jgi:predicted nucleotidyltransferase
VLGLLFAAEDEYTLNALVKRSGGGSGAIRREVDRLLAAGIVRERRVGRQRLIAAEPASPCYAPLKALASPAAARQALAGRETRTPARPPVRPSAALIGRRGAILRVLARHGLSRPRVFGSAARGTDTVRSDLDLLVQARRGVSLLDLSRAQRELEDLLGVRVDLVTEQDLPDAWREAALGEAVSL